MSGHSKWSTIKHKKAKTDAKRGKVFTKLIKEITVAARMGGGDPDANPSLRTAIANGKAQSMPNDNIDRAIKKGSGIAGGENFEEIIYEGYGPHNVAIIVEALTDNRNRTISSIRQAFNKSGGSLGASNSVQYMFDRIGLIYIDKKSIEEDVLMDLILEAEADDLNTDNEDQFEVVTTITNFEPVREFLEKKKIAILRAGIEWVPQNRIEIDAIKSAEQVIKLIDVLEDDEDISKVHSNFDISQAVLEQLG